VVSAFRRAPQRLKLQSLDSNVTIQQSTISTLNCWEVTQNAGAEQLKAWTGRLHDTGSFIEPGSINPLARPCRYDVKGLGEVAATIAD
jgi:hypothetical protein